MRTPSPARLALYAALSAAAFALVPAVSGCSNTSSSADAEDAGSPGSSSTGPGSGATSGASSEPDGGAAASNGDAGPTGSSGRDGGASDGSLAPPSSCAPSWTTTAACGGVPSGAAPDFGANVLVFDPTMSMSSIQSQIDNVYSQQDSAQFGTGRYAFFFKPGKYALDVQVGFYTQVIGLGQSPDDVTITGAVRAKADWLGSNNATCNFWRAAENFAVVPTSAIDSAVDIWATAQGTALRRAHVMGSIALDDSGGWASGGFIADSKIDTQISSGSQQQYLTRNVDLTNWQGSNWNMVFVGDNQAPDDSWPDPPDTNVAATPTIREKPFLYTDASGNYYVMVPAMKAASKGSSWGTGTAPGNAISIDAFYVAKPATDTDVTLNAALAAGKHLLFTPGIYHFTSPVHVTRPGTIVLGLGLATLIPDSGNALFTIDDVDSVTVGGLLLEAGPTSSPVLFQVGAAGSTASHAQTPTALFDLHCRIGGADVGTAANCVTVNSNDVLIDNAWLWRADHGAGADWNTNMSKNGLIVNGNGVTAYGLFVEHFQEFQTLWNGNGGAVYFYQSEMPYDPPNQGAWMESANVNGYPSYKVADSVTSHTAKGLGVYSVFTNDVQAANAFETPKASGVVMNHLVTVSLASGSIDNIIDGTGGAVANGGNMVAKSSD